MLQGLINRVFGTRHDRELKRVQQAVELDARRHAIASLADHGDINPWEEAALITALQPILAAVLSGWLLSERTNARRETPAYAGVSLCARHERDLGGESPSASWSSSGSISSPRAERRPISAKPGCR